MPGASTGDPNRAANAVLFRWVENTFAMEVHDTRGRTHRPRAEQQVEREVALKVIEQEPQAALQPESRVCADEGARGVFAAAL